MTIALSTHRARTLAPCARSMLPRLDDQQSGGRTRATEARIDTSGSAGILFGEFCLIPSQRLLLEAGQPVQLGSRALDILVALIERHGELVHKKVLMERVWPGITVVEANLSVHVSALRRALRDGKAGNRYLINIPAQGYLFVAPITVMEGLPPSSSSVTTMAHEIELHDMLTRLIGTADQVKKLAAQLLQVSNSTFSRSTNGL